MHQFSDKTDIFDILGPDLPKNRFWGQDFENLSLDSELAFLRYYSWDTIKKKQTTLNFWAQISTKIDFGVGISKI